MINMHPLLDQEKQSRARRYEKEKRLWGLAEIAAGLVFLLLFYFRGLSSRLAGLEVGSPVLHFALYAAVFYSLFMIWRLPIGYFRDYVHEHRWGFSIQTSAAWAGDQLKDFFLGLGISVIVLVILFLLMTSNPGMWWLTAALIMTGLSIIFTMLLPVVIMPIFNRYKRIENPELTAELEKILRREGLRPSGFYEEDMSRRTKKENAFLAGLGKTRRVVLGDNLIRNMRIPEITAIIAHEVGHYRFRHIWKGLAWTAFRQLAVFFLLDRSLRIFFPGYLFSIPETLNLFPMMAVILSAVSGCIFSPLGNALSRYFERQADRYALNAVEDKRAFIKALAGLADRNLSNAYPVWWVRLLYYSHPPVGERLSLAEELILRSQR